MIVTVLNKRAQNRLDNIDMQDNTDFKGEKALQSLYIHTSVNTLFERLMSEFLSLCMISEISVFFLFLLIAH